MEGTLVLSPSIDQSSYFGLIFDNETTYLQDILKSDNNQVMCYIIYKL